MYGLTQIQIAIAVNSKSIGQAEEIESFKQNLKEVNLALLVKQNLELVRLSQARNIVIAKIVGISNF